MHDNSTRHGGAGPFALVSLFLVVGCPESGEVASSGAPSDGTIEPSTGSATPTTGAPAGTGDPGTTASGSSTGGPGDTSAAASTGNDGTSAATRATDATTGNAGTFSTTDPGEHTSDTTGPAQEHPVEVAVVGLVDDSATFVLNGDEPRVVTGPGTFGFTGALAVGAAYAVTLAVEPAHYTCVLGDAVGVMPAGGVVVDSTCAARPSPDLRISEVGFGYYVNDSFWLELVNVGAQARSLAGVTLRAPAIALDAGNKYAGDAGMQEFPLPALVLQPGARLLVRSAIVGETAAGPGMAIVSLPGNIVPHWGGHGALELRAQGGSIDYVAWGDIPPAKVAALAPALPSAWPGYPAGLAAAPAVQDVQARGRSLARALVPADSNAAADWGALLFSTPAGPNDTHGCDADVDLDGLPDCAEAPGASYAGVDLHTYGARPGVRDIFVEVDAMVPVDAGMVPQRAALDRIVDVFAEHGFALHFDVGDLFDEGPGIDPEDHDLGGGAQIPFFERVCFDVTPNCAWMVQLKADHFTLARLGSFHHAVFAHHGMTDTVGGQGERPGNDLYISFGSKGFKTDTVKARNILINNQAQALMHELGHNLGLSHGGFSRHTGAALADEANWKPNYFSVMNYLYDHGLPPLGPLEGERYYFEHEDENPACLAKGVDMCTMVGSLCGDPAQLRLDFSHGLGAPIDTAAVVEAWGLRQPGSAGVDFDCDGVIEAAPYASTLFAAVDGEDAPLTLLRDHDDWGALDLFFVKTFSGFGNGRVYAPTEGDVQPRGPADPIAPAVRAWLRRR